MPLLTPRLRRRIVAGGLLLIFVVLAGVTYQGVATALERRDFPHPGGLVGIGDHQLHIHCVGKGAPTVILESAAAAPSAAWGDVQQLVAATTRVCSYDRSGLGWSEAGDRPFDPGRVPEELRTLLTAAGHQGPFVVAGHGLGALFARTYAARPDSETAVLIAIAPPGGDAGGDETGWMMPMAPWLARTGVLRAGGMLSGKADALSEPWRSAVRAFLNRPDHLARAAAELGKWDEAVRLAEEATLDPHVAVVTVDVAARERVAFLHAGDIAPVVAAIQAAVESVRGRPGGL